MQIKFTYWKESDGKLLGYLNDYPDHWTQGENLEEFGLAPDPTLVLTMEVNPLHA